MRRPCHSAAVAAGVALIGIGIAAWLSWFLVGAILVRDGLAWAKTEIKAGRHAPARDWLSWLSRWWPENGEVDYLLGTCESVLGRTGAALTAWKRVPVGSPLTSAAALAQGRALATSQGRFREAEDAYRTAMRGRGPRRPRPAGHSPCSCSGKAGSTKFARLSTKSGGPASAGIELPRSGSTGGSIRSSSLPRSSSRCSKRRSFSRPATTAPGWLAQYLATRYGRYDEARAWLDAALREHPDDPVIWRAILELGLAADNPAEASRALTHLRAEQLSGPERLAIRAWLAAHRHDTEAEQIALEQLIGAEPGNSRGLDRLAALASQKGQADRARMLGGRRESIQHDQDRYRRLLIEDLTSIPLGNIRERSQIAERVGRWFEAKGWWTLAAEQDPRDQRARDALVRLARPSPVSNDAGDMAPLLDLAASAVNPAIATTPESVTKSKPNSGTIHFRDDAEAARLSFTYRNGETPDHQIPETIGGGVAVLDYDRDGWLDVYVVQGGRLPGTPHPASADTANDDQAPCGDRLFRNRRDGTFEDVTTRAGLTRLSQGYGLAVTAADYDDDGHTDLFVSRLGSYALFRNRGDGTFDDATEVAGLGGGRDWPTSAVFADFDGDGDLDLYVCHYLKWDTTHPTICHDARVARRKVSCLPLGFPAQPDHLFRNDAGHFVDITAAAGIVDRDGRGLGVVASDFDLDGRVDLFVANDMTANYLFHNLGQMKFEEIGHAAGVACNAEGGYQAGMGCACGDLDGDGRPDLAVTNFFGESTTLYKNLGGGLFTDATAASGLKAPSRFLLGFGITFLDVDNDGCLDLATANGHIHDLRPNAPYAMPAQLFRGDGRGRLSDLTLQSGSAWSVPRVGRGMASGDFDNDGRIDLVIVAQNTPLSYLHNQTPRPGHFVSIQLEGSASNRDAIGTTVTIATRGKRQTASHAAEAAMRLPATLAFISGLATRRSSTPWKFAGPRDESISFATWGPIPAT